MEEKRITIFSIPKGFDDPHIAHIQRNAIASWCAVRGAEVLLMGNDPGVREEALRAGARHIPDIAVSEFGTPYLDSGFAIAHGQAQAPYVMYVNGDIILPSDFTDILARLPEGPFLAVGQRTDLDIRADEQVIDSASLEALFARAARDGSLHSVQGIDYFLFRRGQYPAMPPFAIGRMAFDAWLLWAARDAGMRLIDVTGVVTAIHQNHPPVSASAGAARKTNPEAVKNHSFVKRKTHFFTIADAEWRLTPEGLRRNWLYFKPYLKRAVKAALGR